MAQTDTFNELEHCFSTWSWWEFSCLMTFGDVWCILDCHDLEWTEARDSARQYALLNRGHPVHRPQQQRLTQAKMSVVPR